MCKLPPHCKCLKNTQLDRLTGDNQSNDQSNYGLEQLTIPAPFSHTFVSVSGIARYVIDIYEAEVPLKYMNQICEEPRRRAQVEVRSQSEGKTPLLLVCIINTSQPRRSFCFSADTPIVRIWNLAGWDFAPLCVYVWVGVGVFFFQILYLLTFATSPHAAYVGLFSTCWA